MENYIRYNSRSSGKLAISLGSSREFPEFSAELAEKLEAFNGLTLRGKPASKFNLKKLKQL
jgi:hypothetical protein